MSLMLEEYEKPSCRLAARGSRRPRINLPPRPVHRHRRKPSSRLLQLSRKERHSKRPPHRKPKPSRLKLRLLLLSRKPLHSKRPPRRKLKPSRLKLRLLPRQHRPLSSNPRFAAPI